MAVESAVHASLLRELGAADKMAGVFNVHYIVDSTLLHAVSNGILSDYGTTATPNRERLLADSVDALLIPPVEGTDEGPFSALPIPIVACRDYLEPTPLARAEWARYYGRIAGRGTRADSLFAAVEQDYLSLAAALKDSLKHPIRAITDLPVNGVWYVPGANSYLAVLYADAGYTLPCSEPFAQSGSVACDVEYVIAHGMDADVWLIKYASPHPLSYKSLAKFYPFATRMHAFRNRQIYVCNTLYVPYYEEVPFHPERLLRDLRLHSGRYFTPLPEE